MTVFFTIIISLNQSYDGDNLCAAETWHNFDVKLARLIDGNVSEGGQLLREAGHACSLCIVYVSSHKQKGENPNPGKHMKEAKITVLQQRITLTLWNNG